LECHFEVSFGKDEKDLPADGIMVIATRVNSEVEKSFLLLVDVILFVWLKYILQQKRSVKKVFQGNIRPLL